MNRPIKETIFTIGDAQYRAADASFILQNSIMSQAKMRPASFKYLEDNNE